MNDLLHRYFGTFDLASVDPRSIASGIDRMLVDFGLEQDRSRRFALWSMLYMLDAAPDLAIAFEDDADREAARKLMGLMAAAGPESDDS